MLASSICYNNFMLSQNSLFNQNLKHIHFVGIGGVSVSSLSIFAQRMHVKVTGSDICKSDVTLELEKQGIKIFYHHQKENIQGADLVVYSSACENNIEVQTAISNGIKVMSRAQFLAQILKQYPSSVCIAGAHGKTTTTALIFQILKQDGQMPSLHLGGALAKTGKSFEYNSGSIIVCEACEYKDSFLEFSPSTSVVLNIAPEHLDYFKTFKNVQNSFNKFISQSDFVIVNSSLNVSHKNMLTFGLENANFTAQNIKMLSNGKYTFDCYFNGKKYAHIRLNLIGRHNILNALASIAVAHHLNVKKQSICKALSTFEGVERRFQFLHKSKFIVHDYAHHPDEIASSISETLNFYKGKLLVVFQPHTYSRTKLLMQNFVSVLKPVKDVLIIPTYPAREKYCYSGSALALKRHLGDNAIYIKDESQIVSYINEKIKQGYGVLFLGAGNIYTLAKNVAKMC